MAKKGKYTITAAGNTITISPNKPVEEQLIKLASKELCNQLDEAVFNSVFDISRSKVEKLSREDIQNYFE